jgi:hypothetical protein
MGAFEGERLLFEISVVTNQIFVFQSKVSDWCFCLNPQNVHFKGVLILSRRELSKDHSVLKRSCCSVLFLSSVTLSFCLFSFLIGFLLLFCSHFLSGFLGHLLFLLCFVELASVMAESSCGR